jgi:hypothetical protein
MCKIPVITAESIMPLAEQEEFTSFLIAVHATAERPSHATQQRPQRYLRGSNVRPPIDKPDVPCLKKIAYLATSVLTPRNAINKVRTLSPHLMVL